MFTFLKIADCSHFFVSRIWAVNVKPIVNISQVIAKKWVESKKPGIVLVLYLYFWKCQLFVCNFYVLGAIVNVSSQASLVGMPRHTSYGASKACDPYSAVCLHFCKSADFIFAGVSSYCFTSVKILNFQRISRLANLNFDTFQVQKI